MPERHHEPHNAIPLYARGQHWIECTCGWLTKVYRSQPPALVAHAEHIHASKQHPPRVLRWSK